MKRITLGKTGIEIDKCGFGALPIQRVPKDEAVELIRFAYDGGIRFFDSAHGYTDSEEKLGCALKDVRENVYISTKANDFTVEGFWQDLNASLERLQTSYIDIFQFHNPSFCPKPGDGTGLYEAMLEAKAKGLIHYIGITNHALNVANEAIDSGLYDTLQFPFSYLATDPELELVKKCEAANMGFIAMKGMAGGAITNAKAAYAYIYQFDHVLPIWGVQRKEEIEEFLSYNADPVMMDDDLRKVIEKDRVELAGEFCRGCGYCMPCPMGIKINVCARTALLLKRAPTKRWLSEAWQAEMNKIDSCINCRQCASKCPYGLDTPELLRSNLKEFRKILEQQGK